MITIEIYLEEFMKISIGAFIKEGPWGGGNLFFKNLKEHLEGNGHHVINHLFDHDIDLILLTDPRKKSESSSYTDKEILKYKKYINPNVKVVHRINECDERKDTKGLNQFLFKANECSDATVFVSNWIKDLYENHGFNTSNPHVIMSGSNAKIFNFNNKNVWNKNEKIKIITHHWSDNWNKGFDIYQRLDSLLNEPKYSENFEFVYIGNIPNNFSFQNTKVIDPLAGPPLAEELRKCDLYLTASRNEPSGNHHIEGALCGLPILYINSGALPEYCNGYGIGFDVENFETKLFEIKDSYHFIKEQMINYPYKSEKMCEEYENLFLEIIKENIQVRNNKISKNYFRKIINKIRSFIMLNLLKKNKFWK